MDLLIELDGYLISNWTESQCCGSYALPEAVPDGLVTLGDIVCLLEILTIEGQVFTKFDFLLSPLALLSQDRDWK